MGSCNRPPMDNSARAFISILLNSIKENDVRLGLQTPKDSTLGIKVDNNMEICIDNYSVIL